MDLCSLSDEVLLMVLSHLTTRELLQCRAVCHRWASLAQDPTLWRDRLVDAETVDWSGAANSDTRWKFVAAVLNFAPSLAGLGLNLSSKGADALWGTLISTSCAISEVSFTFRSADAIYAAPIISRQASLGRLKVVLLKVQGISDKTKSPGSVRSLSSLLTHISHIQGLEEIVLNHDDDKRIIMTDAVVELTKGVGRASATAPVPASLKRLYVEDFHSFCEPLLQWHADTLEYVSLVGCAPPSALAASLLSRMPRLEELAAPPLEGMRALLQCPSLTTLELFLDDGPTFADRFPEACALVRGLACTQLKHLTLIPKGNTVNSACTLLRCLEGSGPTAAMLRSLRFNLNFEKEQRAPLYQQPLVELLHRLPRLSLLDLDSEPAPALLQALDGRAVPRLRQLVVRLPTAFAPGCQHQYIHSESVRTLLRNYSRLHVVVKSVLFADGCKRGCCKEACHAVPDGAWCMLFGHEVGARCGVPHGPLYWDYTMHEDVACVTFRIPTRKA